VRWTPLTRYGLPPQRCHCLIGTLLFGIGLRTKQAWDLVPTAVFRGSFCGRGHFSTFVSLYTVSSNSPCLTNPVQINLTARNSAQHSSSHPPHAPPTCSTFPAIPLDIVNEIADHLASDSDFRSIRAIRACALVSRSWVQPFQRHHFRVISFDSRSVDRWIKTFPVPEESPACHVRDLRVWIEVGSRALEKCAEYTPWFTNVEKLSLLGDGGLPLLRGSSFWRLPESVTTLAIDMGKITLVQVRGIMAQLPNLDNLILSAAESLSRVDTRELSGIGTVLQRSFRGRLVLYNGFVDEDVINMLLETPSGLRFTEVQIHCFTPERLPSAVRLTEACSRTLEKLSYKVTSQCKPPPFFYSSWLLCAEYRC